MRFSPLLLICALISAFPLPSSRGQLVQIRQDFSRDPGWDHYQNRIIGTDMPEVIQDFGWRRTGEKGEIGGRVENSRIQAFYAMPLGRPLSFDDELSASGTLALRHIETRGVAYIGFFNSRRHTWRVWNSLAFRVWEEDNGLGQVMFDWMSSDWQGRGVETDIMLPADGKVHTWSFRYEPEAKADPVWRDRALERHITDQTGNGRPYELQGEEFLFERLKKEEPDLTREALHRRLVAVRDQGLVEYFHRHNQHRWWKRRDAGTGHGRVTLRFDDRTPDVFWFDPEIRRAPASFDRFGLFNVARYGRWIEIALGELTVNGHEFDLAQDPHWEGRNNASRHAEPSFHAMHDYGWSQTNRAGAEPGEIGGIFWRTEPTDPLCSFYGDDVGKLTLDDPISFSGTISFVDGMTDAGAFFGYFNREDQVRPFAPGSEKADTRTANRLGIAIADRTAVGYNFTTLLNTADGEGSRKTGEVFLPDRRRRRFRFDYDPQANAGNGRITVTLDDRTETLDLSPRDRKSGAVLDRFGLANVRSGGNSVEFYLDDISYTARRPPGARPKFIPQTTAEVPYPLKQGGRRY